MSLSNDVLSILQQPKSEIFSGKPANQEQVVYLDTVPQNSLLRNTPVESVPSKIASSITGCMDDLLANPSHFLEAFTKDDRYAYIGIFLIILAVIFYIVSN
jgi:hypothetical protein